MREIKFRAWDKEEKKMYDVLCLNIGFGRKEIDENDIDNPELCVGTECVSVEIMQYTGLKDKNGKEIYEGDIVDTAIQQYKGQIPYGEQTGEVYFKNDGLGQFMIRNKWTNDLMYHKKELEVIGNIYENPELLNKD